MNREKPKILAVSSGGGHWVQLLRLRPAFEGADVVFATVKEGYRSDIGDSEFRVIADGNLSRKLALLRSAWSVLKLLITERPDTVISTGAAPGYFAIRFGKLLRMRTIWVDSVANAEEMSMSGKLARRVAHLWMSQWEHVATEAGAEYAGAVL